MRLNWIAQWLYMERLMNMSNYSCPVYENEDPRLYWSVNF